jgi:hypothetical protein
LKRADREKESRDFNLDFVPPDLEFVPPGFDFVPPGFDFVPKNFDFVHRRSAAAPPMRALRDGHAATTHGGRKGRRARILLANRLGL